jgi:CheY-like chemotaxis protein
MTIDPAVQPLPDIPVAGRLPLATVSRGAALPTDDGRRRLRILVADDDAFAARLMRRLLEQDGHTVRTTGTLHGALALAADGDPIDVLITGHLLPDGTGCELLGRLRRARGPVAAISITGFADPEHARDIAAAHFTVRLVKPITLAQLNTALALVVTPPPDGPSH